MYTKFVQLSSSGLKNIITDDRDFTFIFGNEKININKPLAEFISPKVSNLHHSDQTINFIQFDLPHGSNFLSMKTIFSNDIVYIFHQIANGSLVEINEEQSFKMKLISNLLGNEELYNLLNNLFPNNFNQSDINSYLKKLEMINNFSMESDFKYEISKIIDFVSKNFYTVEKSELMNLSNNIIYSIISNENMRIKSEDSLFDFICEYIENNSDLLSYSDEITLLNEIKIVYLSENKFASFLEMIDPNQISSDLWNNLCSRFVSKEKEVEKLKTNLERYKINENQSSNNNTNYSDKGIIGQLSEKYHGHVYDQNIVCVTASSQFDTYSSVKNIVDLNNKQSYFSSKDRSDQWVQFDFKKRKVKLNGYSITSAPYESGFYHPRKWIIEGSNNGKYDWETLDSQNNLDLNGRNITKKYEIFDCNKFYRFIRLKQTGTTISCDNYLVLSSIEFYGLINEYE